MRTVTVWTDKLPDADGAKTPVSEIAFKPDGTQLIAAAGTRVLVYEASLGELLFPLKGHKDTVYTVAYSADGKRFASGGADRQVIIWSAKAEGILKYQHNDSIQAVSYNPVIGQLASVTSSDFGLWSQDQKNVGKHKLPSKGLCCSWTADGQNLAIGLFNGTVTIRSKTGEEKACIRRSAPVWTLAWNPIRQEKLDVLAVGSWDGKLSFYELKGKQIGRDKELGFDPCCVSFFVTGDYMLISGSNRQAGLYTRDGTFLVVVAEGEDWVWSVKQRPKQFAIAVGTNNGMVYANQLMMSTVHSIYQDLYVFRDNMTEVVIHQLTTDRKLRIPQDDYVRKVAIFKERLAVQLSDKIIIYEIQSGEADLERTVRERINHKLDCSLLCVTSSNLVLCQEKRLTSYDFSGAKKREWVMESTIRYIKVVGGLADREALLVGLKNGSVMKIFVDNAFPIQLVKLSVPIRCLDLSASRTKLAVVDENSSCQVFNLKNKGELLFQEGNANAVAWNSDYEDMLCFSGNGVLNIKTGSLPSYQQKLHGFVVGFKGNKVFCLHYSTMSTIDVPHSHALYRYIEKKDFESAYRVACLGITESDWKMLGTHAMTHLSLEIARRAFIRIREVKFVELLNRIELERKTSGANEAKLLGDILAFQGKYHEAAKCFIKAGMEGRAIEMFCDMKMWEDARKICTQEESVKELIRRQAKWAEDIADTGEALKLYLAAGDFVKAIQLMGSTDMMDKLIEVCRTLPKSDVPLISECGAIFRKRGAMAHAIEAYERIGDNKSLLQLYVEAGMWDDAFKLLDRFPQYTTDVYVPYAAWLATNDRFEDAQEAFKKANRPQEALHMMEQLATNAVMMSRFRDASFYFFKLSQECLAVASDTTKEECVQRAARFAEYTRRSDLYFAYDLIHKYVSQPFTSTEAAVLFNASKFLITTLGENESVPANINQLDVLVALGRLTTSLGMYRMARTVHERLQQYVIPSHLLEQLDIATMVMRGRPYQDKEDLLAMCYRCGQTNPGLSALGDRCTHCKHPFIRSANSFEVLPLVEFVLGQDITDSEFEQMVTRGHGSHPQKTQWTEKNESEGTNVMTMEDQIIDAIATTDPNAAAPNDPFSRQLMQLELGGRVKEYTPLYVTAEIMQQHHNKFSRDRVFIQSFKGKVPVPTRYYYNMVAELGITMCPTCKHLFHEEDFEYECLKNNGACPICRTKPAAVGADVSMTASPPRSRT